ncbi:MAG: L-glyceraldehyde 3-phosphate reductase [Armatimonadetes bacterium 55-13]|nr:aldo/keto reductase [Armatimonadota bacterium]OJU64234.1 MAG: L-glyceraldehyde 3-phosphate reductase [Armatimonadetes bacterium 55-13]
MPSFNPSRYDSMLYRRCGRSGLLLPAVSLGAWETFGGYRGEDVARECLTTAFDLGITHFDLANNYGTPPGNAEIVCGKIIQEMPRDELIISSKAGFRMWDGPYGEWGSKKYIVASCDQSLKRMGLEYFDIFYSHRFDPETPLDETMDALDTLVRQGKALYAAISNYGGQSTRDAAAVAKTRILANQCYYHMLSRGIEGDLLVAARELGMGLVAFCPLASGILTDKYLDGSAPARSRAAEKWGQEWLDRNLSPERLDVLRALNKMAGERGQTLAQMALAFLLRLPEVTTVLIGASSADQVRENVASLGNLEFSAEELATIDQLTSG